METKRIAVIGGTGMTGECVVEYALEQGHHVTLLYRNKKTVPDICKVERHVELVKGDVLNLDDCKRVVKGADCVCIVLGTRNVLEETTDMSTGTNNLIVAMKEAKTKSFSIVMSSFLFRKESEVPEAFRHINNEHKRMLELTKASDLNFIAVLPPHIADERASGITVTHDSSPGRKVSKYDLAKFLVDCLGDEKHYGKVCGVATLGKPPPLF